MVESKGCVTMVKVLSIAQVVFNELRLLGREGRIKKMCVWPLTIKVIRGALAFQ